MRTTLRILSSSLLFAACIALGSLEVLNAKVPELLESPSKFDGKEVRVAGAVDAFQQKTSRRGNKYFTFKLKEGEKLVSVFSQGTAEPALKDGAKVEVTGVFRKEKKVGDVVYKNEIDATKQDGKPYGVKPVK